MVPFATHTYRLSGLVDGTLLIYVAVFTLTHSTISANGSAKLAWGALAGLMLMVPGLYYLLLVRPGYSSCVAIAVDAPAALAAAIREYAGIQ